MFETEHNVYDFDETIYDGDSTIDFYRYCILKYPQILLLSPLAVFGGVQYLFGCISKTRFKEIFYLFIRWIPDVEKTVDMFWMHQLKRIKTWYLMNKQGNDIIISASPEFLLRPLIDRLGISQIIASKVDKKSGKYSGENCYGEEKVRRFKQEFGDCIINEFYSDSLSDLPLARLAKQSFLVKGEEIKKWVI